MKNAIRISLLVLAILGLGIPFTPSQSADLRGTGVVLIHGKAGQTRHFGPLASALSAEGALVATPAMSWVGAYRTYDETLQEVAAQMAALRSRGATRMILIGHSLGANVAIGYAARRGDVAAVVAMAPGHDPERIIRHTGEAVQRAKAMVAAGRGSEVASFVDVNQGNSYPIRTTAAAYASFFDPDGAAVMARNAARMGGIPVLWVIGSQDRGGQAHGALGGRVISVAAGHANTPSVGAREVVAWLKALP